MAARIADRDVVGHQLVEIGAVGEPGQAVEARHAADPLLGLDAGRHLVEGDDAEFVVALAGRELEIAAVLQPQQHLAPPALAQRAGELRLGIARILEAEHAARDAAHQQAAQRAPEQLLGMADLHQRGGLRIGDRHLALGAEHDEARCHGVQRAVEPAGEPLGRLLGAQRREQHVPDIGRETPDREEERDRQAAEQDVVDVPAQDEPHRYRPRHGHDEQHDHARRAVVAPGDGGGRGQRHADRGDLAEIVGRPVDGEKAEHPQEEAVRRAVDDIDALALLRFGEVGRRRLARIVAHASQAQHRQHAHGDRQPEIDRVRRIEVDEDDQEDLRGEADGKGHAVAEQRLHERYVYVERKLVSGSCWHTEAPPPGPRPCQTRIKKGLLSGFDAYSAAFRTGAGCAASRFV